MPDIMTIEIHSQIKPESNSVQKHKYKLWQNRFFVIVILFLMLIIWIKPAKALPLWLSRNSKSEIEKSISTDYQSSKIQEVAPPGATLQIQQYLKNRNPIIKLESPSTNEIISSDEVEIVLNIDDWPISYDKDLGIGTHIVLQIDDRAPMRFTEIQNKSS